MADHIKKFKLKSETSVTYKENLIFMIEEWHLVHT